MLGVYDFCGHYEWTFEWLSQVGGDTLVHEYWDEAISHDSQGHARKLITQLGFEGMARHWTPTLEEEGGESVITMQEDVFRIDMHVCPSKGFLLDNGLEQYEDYCDHCMGWIHPVMQEAGFRIDHQHNHCGQCWWEMRRLQDETPCSSPGEISGKQDIRFFPLWNAGGKRDSFWSASNPQKVVEEINSSTEDPSPKNSITIMTPHFITALATPLSDDDGLNVEALESLIAQQTASGIHSFLAGGTMGAMQLLPDQTYRDLMTQVIRLTAGQGEIMAGAGDAAFERTRQRIEFLNTLPFDGVVVLAPYVMPFSQEELIDYFSALAEVSRAPLFLYDLPGLTRNKISLESAISLSKHSNISGIKCSDEPGYARQLRDLVDDEFRVIVAAPKLTDIFLRSGLSEHLDGVYCLCPALVTGIGEVSVLGNWERAAELQQRINRVLNLLHSAEVWRPFTALLNALGVPGHFKPRPHRDWDEAATRNFLETPEIQEVLSWLQTPLLADSQV